MGGGWREYPRSDGGNSSAHPGTPGGGRSAGFLRPPHGTRDQQHPPHPDSSAGRHFDFGFDIFERVNAVRHAAIRAEQYAADEIAKATGEELSEALSGIIPGLLLCFCAVAASAALGAAAGGAIGALVFGVGAAPGALLGAEAGLEASAFVLEWLGVGMLVGQIGSSLVRAAELAMRGVREAWNAADEDSFWRGTAVDRAGHTLAQALAELVRGLLQGVVAFLTAKGASKAASRLPELVATLRKSRLGEGFATWVERNWSRLLKNEKLKGEPQKAGGAGGGNAGPSAASGNQTSPPAAASQRGNPGASNKPTTPSGAGEPKGPSSSRKSAGQTAPAAKPPSADEAVAKSAESEPQPTAASEGDPVAPEQSTYTGEPVDVATGKVFYAHTDVELPGALGFVWKRQWLSTSSYAGPLGHGWQHSYDIVLEVQRERVTYKTVDGRYLDFPRVQPGRTYFDRKERVTLECHEGGYTLRLRDRRSLRFAPQPGHPGRYVLSSVDDSSGGKTSLHYDEQGRLSHIIDFGGRCIRLQHDEHGRISSLSAPHPDKLGEHSVLMRYAYDAQGNLSEATDALGHTARYRYEDRHMVQHTDKNGVSFYYTYSGRGPKARCTRTFGDDGIYDRKLSYDVERGITTTVDSLGYKTVYEHRGGLVLREVDPLGAVKLTEYDEHNQKRAEVDALGQRTSFFYDERGNLIRVLRPDGTQVRATYDAADNLERVIEPNGATWRYQYDAQGRTVERCDPLGQRTQYAYSGAHLSSITDPAGGRYQLVHDANGNLIETRAPDGSVRRWTYDQLGRPIGAIDPHGNKQSLTRDSLGYVTEVREPDGNIRRLAYDAEGNLTHFLDKHRDIRLQHQGLGKLVARTEGGKTVHFEYDTEERLCGVYNAKGQAYRFELGPTGEVEAEITWAGQRKTYRRDLLGRIIERRRASGVTSQYSYDALGQLTSVAHSDGEQETYSYARNGSLNAANNRSCQLRFERDLRGRVLKEMRDQHWVESRYDARGLRVELRSSQGAHQTITRDAMGRLQRAQTGGFQLQVERDKLGLEIERKLPGGARSQWRRDKLGRPVTHMVQSNDNQTRTCQYSWDADDRLLELMDSNHGLTRYGYDESARLAWARYTYGAVDMRLPDDLGNLFRSETRSDRAYGPAGELLEARDDRKRITTYTYDADGNLIEKVEPGARRWRYSWNAAGRLTRVTRPDGSEVMFAYDALGRRISKHHRGQTTHFVWDGNVPLHEWVEGALAVLVDEREGQQTPLDSQIKQREAALQTHLAQGPPERGSSAAPLTWLFEPESFVPMARLSGGRGQAIVTDHLGTPMTMLDSAGAVTWSASVDTYGAVHHLRRGTRLTCPFRFQGQYEDAETGLYYNRFRYYDPDGGTYISQDPIGIAGGLRAYGYVEDPTAWIDPLGLAGECAGQNAKPSSRGYDRPEVETKSGRAVKDPLKRWDEFLGEDQTNIDPRDNLNDPDRIWSADGSRSVRFGEHEMSSSPNKFHYHEETWHSDRVENVLQRIPQR